ncbi:hypothetical protein GCM10010282_14700 [Streptomyces roseolus]|nr:hypothetical protein GCM10010282_14700 [Streptomyces roseolus]
MPPGGVRVLPGAGSSPRGEGVGTAAAPADAPAGPFLQVWKGGRASWPPHWLAAAAVLTLSMNTGHPSSGPVFRTAYGIDLPSDAVRGLVIRDD